MVRIIEALLSSVTMVEWFKFIFILILLSVLKTKSKTIYFERFKLLRRCTFCVFFIVFILRT